MAGKPAHVRIDTGNRGCAICAAGRDGRVLERAKYPNRQEAAAGFAKRAPLRGAGWGSFGPTNRPFAGRRAAGDRTIHIIRLRPVRRPKGARPQGRHSGAPLPRPQDRMLACPVRGKAADPQIELRLRTRSNLAAPAVRAQFPHVQARTGRMPPPLPPENGPSTYNAGTKTHIKWDAPICRHETQEAPQAEEIKFKESWRFGPRRRRSERNRTSVVGSRPGRALWPKGRAGPRQGKSFARFHGPALRGRRAAGL